MSYLGIGNTHYIKYFVIEPLEDPHGREAEATKNLRALLNTHFLHKKFTMRDLAHVMFQEGFLQNPMPETTQVKSLANTLASMRGLVKCRVKKRANQEIPALGAWKPRKAQAEEPSLWSDGPVVLICALLALALLAWLVMH